MLVLRGVTLGSFNFFIFKVFMALGLFMETLYLFKAYCDFFTVSTMGFITVLNFFPSTELSSQISETVKGCTLWIRHPPGTPLQQI